MPNAVRPIPEGYHSITPQLTCRDAARAIDFYKNVFGAQEIMRMQSPGGKVMHAELQLGDSRFMLNDEMPGMSVAPSPSPMQPTSLFVYTEDVDTLYNRALKAGAKENMAPSNMFWGDRCGTVVDPDGYSWMIATHKTEPSVKDMKKAMKEQVEAMKQKSSSAIAA